jgi:hypothetical protein
MFNLNKLIMSKYNHSAKKITEACGISDERSEEIEKILKNIQDGTTCWSELIEKFAKNFTRDEMAFIHVMDKKTEAADKVIKEGVKELFSKIGAVKDKSDEKIPSFLMGSGGKA